MEIALDWNRPLLEPYNLLYEEIRSSNDYLVNQHPDDWQFASDCYTDDSELSLLSEPNSSLSMEVDSEASELQEVGFGGMEAD